MTKEEFIYLFPILGLAVFLASHSWDRSQVREYTIRLGLTWFVVGGLCLIGFSYFRGLNTFNFVSHGLAHLKWTAALEYDSARVLKRTFILLSPLLPLIFLFRKKDLRFWLIPAGLLLIVFGRQYGTILLHGGSDLVYWGNIIITPMIFLSLFGLLRHISESTPGAPLVARRIGLALLLFTIISTHGGIKSRFVDDFLLAAGSDLSKIVDENAQLAELSKQIPPAEPGRLEFFGAEAGLQMPFILNRSHLEAPWIWMQYRTDLILQSRFFIVRKSNQDEFLEELLKSFPHQRLETADFTLYLRTE